MKTNPNDCAYPANRNTDTEAGLDKLEAIAKAAMQGLMTTLTPLSDNQFVPNTENVEYCARLAVVAAQALINELNKAENQALSQPPVSGSLPTQEEFVKEYERREGCELPKGYSKKDYLAGFHQCWKWIHHEMSTVSGSLPPECIAPMGGKFGCNHPDGTCIMCGCNKPTP